MGREYKQSPHVVSSLAGYLMTCMETDWPLHNVSGTGSASVVIWRTEIMKLSLQRQLKTVNLQFRYNVKNFTWETRRDITKRRLRCIWGESATELNYAEAMERNNIDQPTRNLPRAVPLPSVPACSLFFYSHLAPLFKVMLLEEQHDNIHSWQALWAGWHWPEEDWRWYNNKQSLGSLEHLPHDYPTGLLSVASVHPWKRSKNIIFSLHRQTFSFRTNR